MMGMDKEAPACTTCCSRHFPTVTPPPPLAAQRLGALTTPTAEGGGGGGGGSGRWAGGSQQPQQQQPLLPAVCLTPLGRHLAALPVEPRLGKLLVLGACLACLGPAATIAAAMSHKSPFASQMGAERKADSGLARKALSAPGER